MNNIKPLVDELVQACVKDGRLIYQDTYHAPELGIPDGEYWVVSVRRVALVREMREELAGELLGVPV
jgi:hypothetical protein